MSQDIQCPPPDPNAVCDFLAAFKLAIGYERCEFRGRSRTQQDLINLNLTRRLALETICELTPSNYSAGPTPDDTDQSKDVWSFHRAQHPMRYPLRGTNP